MFPFSLPHSGKIISYLRSRIQDLDWLVISQDQQLL